MSTRLHINRLTDKEFLYQLTGKNCPLRASVMYLLVVVVVVSDFCVGIAYHKYNGFMYLFLFMKICVETSS